MDPNPNPNPNPYPYKEEQGYKRRTPSPRRQRRGDAFMSGGARDGGRRNSSFGSGVRLTSTTAPRGLPILPVRLPNLPVRLPNLPV
jgi:hypothetical protein